MSNPANKTVLITGCSDGGIGHALAMEFHSKGLRVFATARKLSSMSSLHALGINTLPLDVTDLASIKTVRAQISELTGGRLDVLINNAGQAYPAAATDISLDEVKMLFDVNLFGAMATVQEFIPLLIASGDARIVQTGSISGIMPVPFSAAYNASKAALHSYGDTLRVELAPFNIQVITVITGNVKSNIVKPYELPPHSLYQIISAEFKSIWLNRYQVGATSTQKYAKQVVAEALKRKPKAWFWAGKNAWLAWFISTFFGRRGFDSLMSKTFEISKISRLKNQERKRI